MKYLLFLVLTFPLPIVANHWETTPWAALELVADVPEPFGRLTFHFETNDEGRLVAFTVRKGSQVTEVPQSYYASLEQPQLHRLEIIHDAGFSGIDELDDGTVIISSDTSILVVHLYHGEPQEGSESFPYLSCSFLETAELDSCESYP